MEANVVDHTSMWSLVSNASLVVQLVMLSLVLASLTSWILIFQRSSMLRAARRSPMATARRVMHMKAFSPGA